MTSVPANAQYVVIGGGVVGCSLAYHLAKAGASDVVLLEKAKLTSGSTWHAAGAVAQYRSNANIMRLISESVVLYQSLEAETGQATGWKQLGGLRLASSAARREEYERTITTARSFGLEMGLISASEAKSLFPLMTVDDVDCALFVPSDGSVSPSDVTAALAKGARNFGARIFEGVSVTGFEIANGRLTAVQTTAGNIKTEQAAITAGIWSREIGKLAGVSVPLLASHHCYLLTEKIEGVRANLPFMRDPDLWHYFREEVGGLMLGQYEPDPVAAPFAKLPDNFAFQLMPENAERFLPRMEGMIRRIPALKTAGIRRWFNGLESFTEDQQPILGETPEVRGLYVGCGFNAYGISAGGGFGRALADWMRQGEAQSDLSAADIRRFGAIHRSDLTVRARALEGQGRHYTVHFPFEEIQASRPLRRSALYDRLLTRGAVMGEKAGWERPLWFAPSGVEPVERPSFGVQPWMPHVAAEHRAAREGCVVFDMSSFSKALVVGRDAERVLDRLAVNDMAIAPGRVMHTLMLNRRGGIECDMTAARLSERAFYLVTGTAQATRDFGLIRAGIGAGDNAELVDVTSGFAVLAVMGPRARNLLQPMTEGDLSASAFPYAQVRQLMIAGAPVRVMRVSFVGELGFELHVPTEYAATVYDALRLAGVQDAGYRALDSLRLEKANRACGLDIGPDDSPFEAGIGYVFSQKKMTSFVGRGALEKQLGPPLRRRLVTITLYQPDVLLLGRETLYRNGERAGFLRSGGFGHTIGKPIGLGYVETPDGVSDEVLASGTYELEVATRRYPAALHIAPLYDPAGARMRG